jgi:hypothetical protein
MEVARYILRGMRELARVVRDNSDVKRVKGVSVNLVRQYADKLEKMGFSISRHGDVAWIGRDKFLEYFLNDKG